MNQQGTLTVPSPGTELKKVMAISDEIHSALREPADQLAKVGGDNLVSLTVANVLLSVAGTESKAVSVLVVLRSASPEELAAIAEPVRAIGKLATTSPFVVTGSDLRTSTDIFPIRYRNLQHDYQVLAGTDVLADLTFDLEHVRLRCEQELSNVLIRLRNRYVASHTEPKVMAATLQRAAIAFLITLRTAIELQTGLAPEDLDGIVADAQTALGIEADEISAVREAAAGLIQANRTSIDRVFRLFASAAEKAVSFVDQVASKTGERV